MSARRFAPLLAPLVGLWLAGCLEQPNNQPQPRPFLPRTVNPTTPVSGVVWDPEAWHFSLMMCGPTCSAPPNFMQDFPHYGRSLVPRAEVSLYEDGAPSALPKVGYPDGGVFLFDAVPRSAQVKYFVFAERPDPVLPPPLSGSYDGGVVPTDGGAYLAPIPAATTLLPTRAGRPVAVDSYACYGLRAPLLGNAGVVDAVALHLADAGTPTAPEDLINPARYGGVLVVFLYVPNARSTLVPARGVALEAQGGQVVPVAWSSPAAPPPAAAVDGQSARGYYVDPAATVSPVGTYLVLVPAGSSGAPVMLLPTDPVVDAAKGRPWRYSPFTVTPLAGQLTFVELQGDPLMSMHLSSWECQR